jgi:ParB family transcriptional regulator, chromosome partitioning protein
MAKRNALGKGLSALLENAETDITSFEPRVLNSVANIPISQISANPFQPRSEFEQEALNELAESIRVHGVIQPITVRKSGFEKYEIISGERRTRASILAGNKDIPAYIRLANDQEMLEMALIENIQREELNSIDVSLSYKRLMEECGLKMEELGDRVGKKRSTVNNYLRLLKLPDDIQLGLKEGKISMGHARALVGVEDAITQLTIFDRIIAEGLSVRNAESLARGEKEVVIDDNNSVSASNSSSVKSKKNTTDLDLDVLSDIRNVISEKLGTKVDIKAKAGEKGTLLIHFEGEEELKSILERL